MCWILFGCLDISSMFTRVLKYLRILFLINLFVVDLDKMFKCYLTAMNSKLTALAQRR